MKPILLFLLFASLNAGAQDTTHYPKDTIIVNRRADGRLFLSDSFLHIYPSDTLPQYNIAKVLVLVTDTSARYFRTIKHGDWQIDTVYNDRPYKVNAWELFRNSQSLGYFTDEKGTLPLNPNYVIWQTIVLSYKNYSK